MRQDEPEKPNDDRGGGDASYPDDQTPPSMVHPARVGWNWIRGEYGLEDMACMTFVHGATPEWLVTAYGMDPQQAVPLTLQEAIDRGFPEFHQGDVIPYVRVGKSGEWAFGIETYSLIGTRIRFPRGTAVGMIYWTPKAAYHVSYIVDGTAVVSFEVGMAWDRVGSDPDRFLPQMRELGIRTERPTKFPAEEPIGDEELDSDLQGLAFLTLVAGIRLPEETYTGPLLTCQQSRPGHSTGPPMRDS